MTATVERRFALRRLAQGDYLLLSNDERTLWRIKTYDEDGTAENEDGPVLGRFWGVWRFNRFDWKVMMIHDLADAVEDWDQWTMVDMGYRTRREATASALRLDPSKL